MSKRNNEVVYKEKLLIALEKNLGIVTPSCQEVGISRNQFYVYCREDEEFKQAVDDINNIALDFAENQLLKKIKEGAERSIHFYLAKKGKSRGYGDKIDINVSNDKIKFKFNLDDDELNIEDESN